MNLRTDLATELHELTCKADSEGVSVKNYSVNGVSVSETRVLNRKGEKLIGVPEGIYYTFEVTPFSLFSELFKLPELRLIAGCIESMLPPGAQTVLVAGLGNDEITADALGPMAASMIFSTRHLTPDFSEKLGLGKLRSVASVCTDVIGKTGIEAVEIIRSVVEKIKPSAVITIDALAARRLERLGNTVQVSTGGIVPGSGVGNNRKAINEKTVGVPVISVGVPTVVDGATFAGDILSPYGVVCDKISVGDITVTPKDIDIMTERASRLVAMSINCALHKNLSPEEIFSIVSQ